ncbi:MAG: hypothetical protein ACK57J_14995 [Rubrivivax sp.]
MRRRVRFTRCSGVHWLACALDIDGNSVNPMVLQSAHRTPT